MRRAAVATVAVVLMISLPGIASQLTLRSVAGGLDRPVFVTHANDARLFIVTQRGEVLILERGRVRATPFLDIQSEVRCCGEQGLLGLAFHPRYKENGLLYVTYVDLGGDFVIARYRAVDGKRADAASRSVVLTIPHEQPLHYAGHLAFGPDGYLYISTGDGGDEAYVNAGRLDSLLGKLLRIDVDHEPYAIPSSNPFVERADARGEIWAYGLRNPWRFSFDRETGDLWISDVGQDLREEVNFQPATSTGGENYGWYGMEGTHCHEDSGTCEIAEEVTIAPVIEYAHENGACSVTGGYRYRGRRYPQLYGAFFYADFCTGRVMTAIESDDTTWQPARSLAGSRRISSFGEGVDGELYVIDYLGSVYAVGLRKESKQPGRLEREYL